MKKQLLVFLTTLTLTLNATAEYRITFNNQQIKVPEQGEQYYEIQKIDAGYYYNAILTKSGKVIRFGGDSLGEFDSTLPENETFVNISAGGYHIAALRSDGRVFSAGRDTEGQVSNTPTNKYFSQIATGNNHTIGIMTNGALYGWGWNGHGQLNLPSGTNFVDVGASGATSWARRSNGEVIIFGYADNEANLNNLFPNGYYKDLIITFLSDNAIKHNSDNSFSIYGNNSSDNILNDAPTGTKFSKISCSRYSCTGLKEDNKTFVVWGEDNYNLKNLPLYDSNVTDFVTGQGHLFIWYEDGHIQGHGRDDKGQSSLITNEILKIESDN